MVTVRGTYQTADGQPCSGWVAFTPDVVAADSAIPAVITQAAVAAELDDAGSFIVQVKASDDPGWAVRMPYIITVDVTGLSEGWMAYVDDSPDPVDITSLQPLAVAPDMSPWLTRAQADGLYAPLDTP